MNLENNIAALLEIFGILVAVAAGIRAIIYFLTPYKTMRNDIATLKVRMDEHDKFLKKDKEIIEELTELVRDSVKLQLALVNHEIDGNDIAYMKELRKEIHDKLL